MRNFSCWFCRQKEQKVGCEMLTRLFWSQSSHRNLPQEMLIVSLLLGSQDILIKLISMGLGNKNSTELSLGQFPHANLKRCPLDRSMTHLPLISLPQSSAEFPGYKMFLTFFGYLCHLLFDFWVSPFCHKLSPGYRVWNWGALLAAHLRASYCVPKLSKLFYLYCIGSSTRTLADSGEQSGNLQPFPSTWH